MEPQDEFKNWLKDETIKPLTKTVDRMNKVYIKIPKRENFFYLFCQWHNKSLEAESGHDFEYAALYNKQDGLVYNAGLDFQETFPEAATGPKISRLSKTVNESIRTRLEDFVAQNQTDLSMRKVFEKGLAELEDYKKYQLEKDIQRYFLKGMENSEDENPRYYDHEWTEEDLLDYLEDADGYIERTAEKIWSKRQEAILLEQKIRSLIKTGVEELEKESDSPLHRQRNILYALRNSLAKTVSVTIHKNGVEYRFKTTAAELCRETVASYSTYPMPVKDREQFASLFGGHASYDPEDIVDIAYRGKSLYRAEAYEPQKMEEQESESPTLTL